LKSILAALVAASLVAGWGGEVAAAKVKKGPKSQATAKVHGQRKAKPFDEHAYYERLLVAIPFGTAAWWRQHQEEFGNIE